MNIKIADKAGFCFGVARAVKIACDNAGTDGRTVTFGALIHNKDVTDELLQKGIRIADSMDEICSDMNGANVYGNFTKRALERDFAVFIPQLLLWTFNMETGEKTEVPLDENFLSEFFGCFVAYETTMLGGEEIISF